MSKEKKDLEREIIILKSALRKERKLERSATDRSKIMAKKLKILDEELCVELNARKEIEEKHKELEAKYHSAIGLIICIASLLKVSIRELTWWRRKSFAMEYGDAIEAIEDFMNTKKVQTHSAYERLKDYL